MGSLATLGVGGGGSLTTYAAEVLADSPISYWPLDDPSGTVADDAVTTNDGTYVNTPTLGATGIVQDGGTAVTVAAASSEDITLPTIRLDVDGTVEFWFKWTAGTVLFRDHSQLTNVGWLALDSAGTFQVRIRAAQINTSLATAAVRDGNPHHFVLAKSGANATVYVDGASVGSTSSALNVLTDVPWHFGRNGINAQYSDATYDSIALYSSALSSGRVAAHYAAGT